MKHLLVAVYSLCLAGSLIAARADDTSTSTKSTTTEHKAPTEAQKTARKDLVEKYDANKDGKLDREEMKKFSDEDKEKAKKAGLGPQHKPKKH